MSSQAISTSREIIYLQVDKIRPNIYQPRRFFNPESLKDLSSSIKQYGVLQPISVRLVFPGGFYELIAGERRLRAAKMAGLMTIPAIVMNINDKDSAVIAIIENLQRQDLNYIEEAEGFLNLMEDYNFTQEMLAARIGKSQSTVANKIRLLRLSKDIRRFLMENDLTERHARALLRLSTEEEQMAVLEKIVEDQLNVAQTDMLIEDMINPEKIVQIESVKKSPAVKNKKRKIKFKINDVRIFANTIDQSVEVMKRSGFNTEYEVKECETGYEFVIRVDVKR